MNREKWTSALGYSVEALQWDPKAKASEAPDWFYQGCIEKRLYPEFDGTVHILSEKYLDTPPKDRLICIVQPGDWIIHTSSDHYSGATTDYIKELRKK